MEPNPVQEPMPPSYRTAFAILWNRSAYERGLITDPFGGEEAGLRGLRRMRALLTRLGDPDRAVALIHIAGSKGKGSTAAFAASALTASGRKTGLYSSPHLHNFAERIAIDGNPVSRETFGQAAIRADAAASDLERDDPALGTISTFELLTAMALLVFADEACDTAVIEVGLGGDWDATNVIEPHVAAITRIDLEHTAILGHTHAEIAAAKAGIIKASAPVAIGPNPPEAESVLVAAAERTGSHTLVAGRDWTTNGPWRAATLIGPWGNWSGVELALPGDHQIENAGTAMAALWLLRDRSIVISEAAIRAGFAQVRWPGRFERIEQEGATFVLDGAHTPAAAAALAATLAVEFPNKRAVFVLGLSSDKPAEQIISALAPVTSVIIAVRADNPRSTDPARIVEAATATGIPASTAGSVATGLNAASGHSLVVATGSLYVVGEARQALGLGEPDPIWGPSLADGDPGPVK